MEYKIKHSNNKNIEYIYNKVVNGNYIFKKSVKQHNLINQIYEHPVNPLRIATYIDNNAGVHIISLLMTFCINKMGVSNNSSGGIFVPVDFKRGVLKNTVFQYFEYGGAKTTLHSDSKFVFNEFKIPYFEESLDIIKQALHYLPAKFVGWNIAIRENCPCIMEGNSNPALASLDMSYGGLKKHPIFKDAISGF